MNKKGSHIGMILSFVLFVTAILFLYDLLNEPTKSNEEGEILLNQVKDALDRNLKENVTTATISFPSKTGCVWINTSFLDEGVSKNHSVKKTSGEQINSSIDGDKLSIQKGASPIRIIFAKGLESNSFSSTTCSEIKLSDSGTKFALSEKEEYVEKKIVDFINSFSNEYSANKEKFLLPLTLNYNVRFILENETKLGEEKTASSADFFIKHYPISYLNLSGDLVAGYFEISIW